MMCRRCGHLATAPASGWCSEQQLLLGLHNELLGQRRSFPPSSHWACQTKAGSTVCQSVATPPQRTCPGDQTGDMVGDTLGTCWGHE